MREIVKKMVDFLENAPDGAEYSTSEIFKKIASSLEGKEISSFGELMKLDAELRKEVRKHKIKLDSSKYNDMVVGVPYNLPFVIHKKKE